MDAMEFEQCARKDPQLCAFLQEVVEDITKQVAVEEPQRFSIGVDLLVSIAAYALFRWVKDCFDHRRSLQETEILKQREQVIAKLIQDGFPPEQAQAAAVALLDQIAKRTKDDLVLKKALALVGKGN